MRKMIRLTSAMTLLILAACASERVQSLDAGSMSDSGSADGSAVVDAGSLCDRFCAGEMNVCPTDTACLHSCETAPVAPTEQAIVCVNDTVTCSDTGTCWNMLGL